MNIKNVYQNHNVLAVFSLILSFPAIMLVALGLSLSIFGLPIENSISSQMGFFKRPIFIIGGILIAFILNLVTTIQIKIKSEKNYISTYITNRKLYPNLGILLLTGLLTSIIVLYLFVENFQFISH